MAADAQSDKPRPRTVLDKDDVLTGLFASWEAIEELLSALTDEQWQTPTALPGWTVHDVVSHIVGTEMMLAGSQPPQTASPKPDHVNNEIGAVNERWVEELRAQSPEAMVAKFREVTAQRKAMLLAMTPEQWNTVTVTPAGPDSYGRFMRVRVFDCWFHEHDIRDVVGKPASDRELTGPDSRLALDEMASSMGFVVGKKGQAPEGSRVLLALTGPLSREIKVAVDGRAAVVEDFGGSEPTIVVTVDGRQFARMCGGRPTIPDAPQTIEYEGDIEAGNRIVKNLTFVI